MKKIKNNFINPGSLLRFLRVYRGETQQQVAEACGMWPNEISQFERSNHGISLERALRLSDHVGASLDDLLKDRYANVLPTLPPQPCRNREVQKRLKKHQRHKDKLGRDGEAYVARLEREKLADTPYGNGVNEAFADDLTAGFDVMSFSRDGKPIYIEVKTTSGKASEPFYLTACEKAFLEFCLAQGYRYELHRVHHMGKKAVGRIIYSAEQVMNSLIEPATYIVKVVA